MNNKKRTRLLGSDPVIPIVCAGEGEPGLVSVIIPTYNRAYIIGPTIDSVLAQTYRNFEIIVVDDGSKDDTRAVLEKYGDQVRYLYQPNAGLAAARNTGLAAARGEFIAFQDSDDLWLPWKLEVQVSVMRHIPALCLVWTDMTAVDPQGTLVRNHHLRTMYSAYRKTNVEDHMPIAGVVGDLLPSVPEDLRRIPFRCGDISGVMALGNLVHPPTALIRRTHLSRTGGLDVTFAWTCEDYEFFWRLSRFGPAALVEADGMLYRVDAADQLTRPEYALDISRGNLFALKRHLGKEGAPNNVSRKELRGHLADSYNWVGREELMSDDGKRSNAVRYLWASLRYNPFQIRTAALLLVAVSTPRPLFSYVRSLKRAMLGASVLS